MSGQQRAEFEKVLSSNWHIRSALEMKEEGKEVSSPDYDLKGWYVTEVPTKVLAALVKNGKNVLAIKVFPLQRSDFTIGLVDWNPRPRLWWPNNLGNQNLYKLNLSAFVNVGKIGISFFHLPQNPRHFPQFLPADVPE